jgi:hypothetical protein
MALGLRLKIVQHKVAINSPDPQLVIMENDGIDFNSFRVQLTIIKAGPSKKFANGIFL